MASRERGSDLVLCVPRMVGGGSERVLSMLANAWTRHGLRVWLVALTGEPPAYPLDPGIRFVVLERLADRNAWLRHIRSSLPPVRSASAARPVIAPGDWRRRVVESDAMLRARGIARITDQAWALRRVLEHAGPPVVVSFLPQANVPTILASTGKPWRLVVCERNDPVLDTVPLPYRGFRRLLYRFAHLVTANSHKALRSMEGYVDPRNLAYLPNPVILPDPGAVPPAAERRLAFLAVGRLHPQKACDLLLRAFAQLPEALRAWRLVLVGEGVLRESLESLAKSLGVADRVHWCGWTSDPRPYYASASIFVQPSRTEGMSNALLEAMSHGLPPIVSDTSAGNLELVTHDVSGLVVPTGDVAQLAQAMSRLAFDPVLRARLGTAARERLAPFELPRALAAWEAALGVEPRALGTPDLPRLS